MSLEKIETKEELLQNLHILYDAFYSNNEQEVKIAKGFIKDGKQYIVVRDDCSDIFFAPVKILRYKNYNTVTEYKELSHGDAEDVKGKVVTGSGAYDWFKNNFQFLQTSFLYPSI